MMEEHELGGKLLASVSRSFYLTLKALPAGLREPLSMAYLLARAADTLADTSGVAQSLKMDCLGDFDRLVQCRDRDSAAEQEFCGRLLREFVPMQTDVDEAQLLQRLPEAFAAVRNYPERQLASIRGVLSPIVRGQVLDVSRFPVDGELRALRSEADLDEYTWLVAGCVGEFWTKLCADELPDAFPKNTSTGEQVERGIRLGKGLQMVNILRDIGKDIAMGRCYFPQETLGENGISMRKLQRDPSLLLPLLPRWQERCREHLRCGLEYVSHVEHRRLRYAVALPLLLGVRTLALLEKATWDERVAGVKASRSEVAKIMLEAGIASLRANGIRNMVERFMAELP